MIHDWIRDATAKVRGWKARRLAPGPRFDPRVTREVAVEPPPGETREEQRTRLLWREIVADAGLLLKTQRSHDELAVKLARIARRRGIRW